MATKVSTLGHYVRGFLAVIARTLNGQCICALSYFLFLHQCLILTSSPASVAVSSLGQDQCPNYIPLHTREAMTPVFTAHLHLMLRGTREVALSG